MLSSLKLVHFALVLVYSILLNINSVFPVWNNRGLNC